MLYCQTWSWHFHCKQLKPHHCLLANISRHILGVSLWDVNSGYSLSRFDAIHVLNDKSWYRIAISTEVSNIYVGK